MNSEYYFQKGLRLIVASAVIFALIVLFSAMVSRGFPLWLALVLLVPAPEQSVGNQPNLAIQVTFQPGKHAFLVHSHRIHAVGYPPVLSGGEHDERRIHTFAIPEIQDRATAVGPGRVHEYDA